MKSIRKQLKDLNVSIGSLERQELLMQNVKNAIKGTDETMGRSSHYWNQRCVVARKTKNKGYTGGTAFYDN